MPMAETFFVSAIFFFNRKSTFYLLADSKYIVFRKMGKNIGKW